MAVNEREREHHICNFVLRCDMGNTCHRMDRHFFLDQATSTIFECACQGERSAACSPKTSMAGLLCCERNETTCAKRPA